MASLSGLAILAAGLVITALPDQSVAEASKSAAPEGPGPTGSAAPSAPVAAPTAPAAPAPTPPRDKKELEQRIRAWKREVSEVQPFRPELVEEVRLLLQAVDPKRQPDGRRLLVDYLRRRGRYTQALEELRREPAVEDFLVELRLLDGLGRSDEALVLALERLGRCNPTDITPLPVRAGLAWIYRRWGCTLQAMRLVGNPDDSSMMTGRRRGPPLSSQAPLLAAALRVRCEAEAGATPYPSTLARLREHESDPDALLALAAEARAQQNLLRERELLERANQLVGGGEAAGVELALLRTRAKTEPTAVEARIREIARARYLPEALLTLARLRFARGDDTWRDDANELLRRSPSVLAYASDLVGAMKLERHQRPHPNPPSNLLLAKLYCYDYPPAQRTLALRALLAAAAGVEPWRQVKGYLDQLERSLGAGHVKALELRFQIASARDDFAAVDRLYPQLSSSDPTGQLEFLHAQSLERRGQVRQALKRMEALSQKAKPWSNPAFFKARIIRQGRVGQDMRAMAMMALRHAEAMNLLCQLNMREVNPDPRSQQMRARGLSWCDDVLGCFNTAGSVVIAFGTTELRTRFSLFQRALYHSCSAYPAVMCAEELGYEVLLRRVPVEQWIDLARLVVEAGMLKDDDHPQLHVMQGVFAETEPKAREAFRRALELNPAAVLPACFDELLEARFGSERGKELAGMFQPLPPPEAAGSR